MSANPSLEPLESLTEGMPIVIDGTHVVRVDAELAAAFGPGDRLLSESATGRLIHVPADVAARTTDAIDRAHEAFARMGAVTDEQTATFFRTFADALADEERFAPIAAANDADVVSARERGRSTTRLALTERMRSDMVAGLRGWAEVPSGRDAVTERLDHDGWSVELRRAGLGVVGFVFEGRPNVFADACGLLRSGNTVVFRIGSDALGTARAIVKGALDPALEASGLPPGAASLVDAPERSAGHAMFSDSRLALAVARGSGPAVAQLGAVARAAGNAVSLHGTGGAWMLVTEHADDKRVAGAVGGSLDRKVCNTLNTVVVTRAGADAMVPVVLDALRAAANEQGTNPKLWVHDSARSFVPEHWFAPTTVSRAEGEVIEPGAEAIATDRLGHEWEWEDSPEITLVVADSLADAVELHNRHAPHFVASVLSDDPDEMEPAWRTLDAPFVGNGFTRWVDGQYAFDRPELGLSNWESGRLFGRGGVLSGDSVFTLRARVDQHRPDLAR